jgi:DNA-binding response OmpR family regulator
LADATTPAESRADERRRAILLPYGDRHIDLKPDNRGEFKGFQIHVNFATVTVAVAGTLIRVTKREFLLLSMFVRNRNRILDRRLVLDVWGSRSQHRTVDSAVVRLRKKLREAGEQIETVFGFGYRFNEPDPRSHSVGSAGQRPGSHV